MAALTPTMNDETAPGLGSGPAPPPWSELFALTVEFEVSEENFEAFLTLLRDNAARSVESELGCLRFDILVPENAQSPRTVLLYEIYSDRAAFDHHLASDHYRRFDAETRAFVTFKTAVLFRLCEHAKWPARP